MIKKHFNNITIANKSILNNIFIMFYGWLFINLIIQLLLGTPIIYLTIFLILGFFSILFFYLHGFYNVVNYLIFFFIFNSVLLGIFIKTILLQKINSNLENPLLTFTTILLASFLLFLAFLLALSIPINIRIFKPLTEIKSLKKISIYTFIIGISSWILNQLFLIDRRASFFDKSDSFGGFAVFVPIFFMSIIAAVAYNLLKSDYKRSISIWLFFLLFIGFILGIIESRKIFFALTFLSYSLTVIFFKGDFKKQLLFFLLFLFFIFFIFGPIVHFYRSKLWFMEFDQKIIFLSNNINIIFNFNNFSAYLHNVLNQGWSYNYGYGYFGDKLFFFDRFATIQHIDSILVSFMNKKPMGFSLLSDGYLKILPSFILPSKSTVPIGDYILWISGFKNYGDISFATIPMIAHSFVAFKWVGIIIIPFYIFFIMFILFKILNTNLHMNIFTIYFLLRFVVSIQQMSHTHFVLAFFREIPIHIIVLFLITYLATKKKISFAKE